MLKANGVIDRIVDGKAVIIVESENKEFYTEIQKSSFPLSEGDWLNIELDEYKKIHSIEVNKEMTEKQARKIRKLMSKVEKKGGSKFKV